MAGAPPQPDVVIDFDTAEIKRLAGLDLSDDRIAQILTGLGFEVSGNGAAQKVSVPSWRPDVDQPADLVEEVIRIVGVDQIPTAPMRRTSGIAKPVLTQMQRRARRARRVLAGRGLVEAVTWSFIPREQAKLFGGGSDALELANPISTEMSSMRPSLLTGLLAASHRNHDRGFVNSALFEIGQAYGGDSPEDQFMAAAGVRSGAAPLTGAGRYWSGEAPQAGWADAKADALAVLGALGLEARHVQASRDAPTWFHPGRSGTLRLGPKTVLGHFGEINPRTLQALDMEGPAAAFELFLDNLPAQKRKTRTKPALDVSDLQPVHRDFAFVLDETVPAADVMRAAAGADKGLITDVTLFDIFEGEGLGAGKKSLAIEVTLQPRDKTLTEEEIDSVADAVVAAVTKATGGELRG